MKVFSLPAMQAERPSRTLSDLGYIVAARTYRALGWSGCVGLLCLLLAALYAGYGLWPTKHQAVQATQQHRDAALVAADNTAMDERSQPAIAPPALPSASDAIRLLKEIKACAQRNDLAWPQAEYRIAPLNSESLATLEIRTSLKGPYPKLRQMMVTLLDKEPALALREFTLSRPNGDTAEVEAKIRWVVFLADGWPAGQERAQP